MGSSSPSTGSAGIPSEAGICIAVAIGDHNATIGGEACNLGRAMACEHLYALRKDRPERAELPAHCIIKLGTQIDRLVKQKWPTALILGATASAHVHKF